MDKQILVAVILFWSAMAVAALMPPPEPRTYIIEMAGGNTQKVRAALCLSRVVDNDAFSETQVLEVYCLRPVFHAIAGSIEEEK